MSRAIDGDAVKRRAWDIAEAWRDQGRGYEALLLESVVEQIVDTQPTLTPPNEWVSVKTPPTTQGWYHVAVLDLKTGKYKVEQDLYSIELAKAYGFEPGFCKANRWEERERIDYWCRFPAPPDCRPPEGKEDA